MEILRYTLRPSDQEMIITEKIVCYSKFPRGGNTPSMWDQKNLSQDRTRGENVKRFCCGFV